MLITKSVQVEITTQDVAHMVLDMPPADTFTILRTCINTITIGQVQDFSEASPEAFAALGKEITNLAKAMQ